MLRVETHDSLYLDSGKVIKRYLNYLNVPALDNLTPLEKLTAIVKAHNYKVSFNGESFFYQDPNVVLHASPIDFMARQINTNRGGICFETNSALATILRNQGFKVSLVTSKMYHYNDHPIKYYDIDTHCNLIVLVNEKPYCVDVGMGSYFRHPIPMDGSEYSDATGTYRVASENEGGYALQKKSNTNDEWRTQYAFSETNIKPSELKQNVDQTCADDCHLTKQILYMKPFSDQGYLLLVGTKGEHIQYIRHIDDKRHESVALESPEEAVTILCNEFNVNRKDAEGLTSSFKFEKAEKKSNTPAFGEV